MSNEGFTLLWSKILDSSVWMQDESTRLVWITLLAMKNSEGFVRCVPSALAHRARVSDEACRKALDIFLSPDPESSNPENEGRRIESRPGGWQILNHEEYRFSTEAKREFWRAQKREQKEARAKAPERARKKKEIMAGSGSLAERLALQAEKAGDVEALKRLEEINNKVSRTQREFAEKFHRTIAQAGQQQAGGAGCSTPGVSPGPTPVLEQKESLGPGGGVAAVPAPEGDAADNGERFPEV